MKIRFSSQNVGSDTVINGFMMIDGESKQIIIHPTGKRSKHFNYETLYFVDFFIDVDEDQGEPEQELSVVIDDKSAIAIQKHYTK